MMHPGHGLDDLPDFCFGQDGGQARRFSGSQSINGRLRFFMKDMLVEKQDCAEGLVLG
jgi:hypothetical protein